MSLLQTVKENNEDFEWYPTTKEILTQIHRDLLNRKSSKEGRFSMLDIGAGDGRVFSLLEEINSECPKLSDGSKERIREYFSIEKFAIEKSQTLISAMDKDIILLGTEFDNQTLIDKKVDVIFCNPPYSVFEHWVEKIITEASAEAIYMVIPQRWKDNKSINAMIEKRRIDVETLGTFNFLKAERAARATVDIVKFTLSTSYDNRSSAFSIWFDNEFKIKADVEKESSWEKERSTKAKITALIDSSDFVASLVKYYHADLAKLLSNYKSLENLDSDILKELGVDVGILKKGLESKITGLKALYWDIVFSKLDKINDRLTSKTKDSMKKLLFKNTSIDITSENIYAVVIWVIKNANSYYDEQLKDIYWDITNKENITLYKSNTRIIDDNWRYSRREEVTNYTLDYRIVITSWNTFGGYEFEKVNGLNKRAFERITDICVIAKNLGFEIDLAQLNLIKWEAGKQYQIKFKDEKVFTEVRVYKNGNLHFKFDMKFMKKFNIEASRLNGWIKEAKDAVKEFDISEQEANEMFKSNLRLPTVNPQLYLS